MQVSSSPRSCGLEEQACVISLCIMTVRSFPAAIALAIAAPLALAAMPVTASAQMKPDGERARDYSAFVLALQTALANDDREAVLDMMRLPFRVNHTSSGPGVAEYTVVTVTIETREELSDRFDWLFDDTLRTAIMGQDPADIFAPSEGGMIGNGEMWFDYSCADVACETQGPVQAFVVNRIDGE